MARVKRSVHGRKHHRAVLDQAKGYYGNRSRSYKSANEAVMHALHYAYRDRRAKAAAKAGQAERPANDQSQPPPPPAG